MHLLSKPLLPTRDITDEKTFVDRRAFLTSIGVGLAAGASVLSPRLAAAAPAFRRWQGEEDKLTPYADVTGYNNFYEFGTGKSDPAQNAGSLHPHPWKIEIAGDVKKPGIVDLDEFLRPFQPVERVYRHRCVEGWSMVIPWSGIPLRDIIARIEPGTKAKFVEFTTLHDPKQMPGQNRSVLPWPYVEALRMDEAMNLLTLFVTGVYGKPLPNQNGAPVRLCAPWKYGFKGGKSIVRIRFVEAQPHTTWNIAAPEEYGFYANVNPTVDHPRWTQAREHRAGEFFKRKTLMFNGYAEQVASMYTGLDLRANF